MKHSFAYRATVFEKREGGECHRILLAKTLRASLP
jgi:hypothetical protein